VNVTSPGRHSHRIGNLAHRPVTAEERVHRCAQTPNPKGV
jgi:hypothetical protein